MALCDGGCHDLKTDIGHCGRCGNACATGRDCLNGVCTSRPCDSRCNFDRMCGPSDGSVECVCGSSVEGNGICFDKNKFKCDDTALPRCKLSMDCPVGSACVIEYCDCGTAPSSGVCVRTDGCGDGGADVFGALVKVGETERRRRVTRDGVM